MGLHVRLQLSCRGAFASLGCILARLLYSGRRGSLVLQIGNDHCLGDFPSAFFFIVDVIDVTILLIVLYLFQ